jgi:hypothetical protein
VPPQPYQTAPQPVQQQQPVAPQGHQPAAPCAAGEPDPPAADAQWR